MIASRLIAGCSELNLTIRNGTFQLHESCSHMHKYSAQADTECGLRGSDRNVKILRIGQGSKLFTDELGLSKRQYS